MFMKKSLLLLSLFSCISLTAQDCSEVFISEYLEGLGNNKALEIYNPTGQAVDLSEYFVVRYDNGSGTPTVQNAVQLRGMVASHDVQVAVIDKRNPEGEGQEAPIWDDLMAKADEFYCPDYNVSKAFYWNGNDAVVLFKGKIPADAPLAMPISSLSGVQPVDIFGKTGENPGEPNQGGGWTFDGTPVANGGAVVSTDHFLVRKPTVKKGTTINPTTFKPNEQWDSLSFFVFVFNENGDTIYNNQNVPARRMNVDDLGKHTCDCGNATAVQSIQAEQFGFEVYPNPVEGQQINLLSTSKVEEVIIMNSLGQVVKTVSNAKSYMTIHLNVSPGVYFVTAKGSKGNKLTKKIIVR